jgi:hypothetical protein
LLILPFLEHAISLSRYGFQKLDNKFFADLFANYASLGA